MLLIVRTTVLWCRQGRNVKERRFHLISGAGDFRGTRPSPRRSGATCLFGPCLATQFMSLPRSVCSFPVLRATGWPRPTAAQRRGLLPAMRGSGPRVSTAGPKVPPRKALPPVSCERGSGYEQQSPLVRSRIAAVRCKPPIVTKIIEGRRSQCRGIR